MSNPTNQMKKGKNDTPKSQKGEKSPRSSALEKPFLLTSGKITPTPKMQIGTIEEELINLPFKENVRNY